MSYFRDESSWTHDDLPRFPKRLDPRMNKTYWCRILNRNKARNSHELVGLWYIPRTRSRERGSQGLQVVVFIGPTYHRLLWVGAVMQIGLSLPLSLSYSVTLLPSSIADRVHSLSPSSTCILFIEKTFMAWLDLTVRPFWRTPLPTSPALNIWPWCSCLAKSN